MWHFTAFHCSHYNCLIFGCLIFLYITQISETLKTKSNTDLIIVITISLNMVLLFWGFSHLSWHACCVHPWGWSSWDRTCGISTTKQQEASLGLFLLFSFPPHPQLFLPVKNEFFLHTVTNSCSQGDVWLLGLLSLIFMVFTLQHEAPSGNCKLSWGLTNEKIKYYSEKKNLLCYPQLSNCCTDFARDLRCN